MAHSHRETLPVPPAMNSASGSPKRFIRVLAIPSTYRRTTEEEPVLTRFDALPPTIRQFTGYLLIGGFTTSLNLALFVAMVSAFGWRNGFAATFASTTAYVVTSFLAYLLNSRIAFREHHAGDSAGTVTRFAATFASSAGVSALVFSGAHALAGNSSAALALAQGTSIATVIAWNFTLLRLWVFAPARTGATAHAR